ncbi:MAG: ComF family protein [Gammaproteobacteria bacterium]
MPTSEGLKSIRKQRDRLLSDIWRLIGTRTWRLIGTRTWRLIGASKCLICSMPCSESVEICQHCRLEMPWIEKACSICALPLPQSFGGSNYLCGSCLASGSANRAIDFSWIPFSYRPPVSTLLLRFKNSADLVVGRALAELLAMEVLYRWKVRCAESGFNAGQPAIVPVALHPKKLASRGFNQALELATPLAKITGWPLLPMLIVRTRNTPAFQTLRAGARKRIAHNLFRIKATPPAFVLLIDDVVTTGATSLSAAQCLRQAGCHRVGVVAVARTE